MILSIPEGQNDKLIIDCLSSTWPGLKYLFSTCLHANSYFYCKDSKLLNNIEWTMVPKTKEHDRKRKDFSHTVNSENQDSLDPQLACFTRSWRPMGDILSTYKASILLSEDESRGIKLPSRSWEIWNLSLTLKETQLFPEQVCLPLPSVTCTCLTSLVLLLFIISSLLTWLTQLRDWLPKQMTRTSYAPRTISVPYSSRAWCTYKYFMAKNLIGA